MTEKEKTILSIAGIVVILAALAILLSTAGCRAGFQFEVLNPINQNRAPATPPTPAPSPTPTPVPNDLPPEKPIVGFR